MSSTTGIASLAASFSAMEQAQALQQLQVAQLVQAMEAAKGTASITADSVHISSEALALLEAEAGGE